MRERAHESILGLPFCFVTSVSFVSLKSSIVYLKIKTDQVEAISTSTTKGKAYRSFSLYTLIEDDNDQVYSYIFIDLYFQQWEPYISRRRVGRAKSFELRDLFKDARGLS